MYQDRRLGPEPSQELVVDVLLWRLQSTFAADYGKVGAGECLCYLGTDGNPVRIEYHLSLTRIDNKEQWPYSQTCNQPASGGYRSNLYYYEFHFVGKTAIS